MVRLRGLDRSAPDIQESTSALPELDGMAIFTRVVREMSKCLPINVWGFLT